MEILVALELRLRIGQIDLRLSKRLLGYRQLQFAKLAHPGFGLRYRHRSVLLDVGQVVGRV